MRQPAVPFIGPSVADYNIPGKTTYRTVTMGQLRKGRAPALNNLGRLQPRNNPDSAKYLNKSHVEGGKD